MTETLPTEADENRSGESTDSSRLGDDAEHGPAPDRQARWAVWVFSAYLVFAFFAILFYFGSYHWFFRDEWGFLTDRVNDGPTDLLRPQSEHWVTLPIVAFRVMYGVVGLRSYVPYQAMVVLLHLGCCALIRCVMRRAGVGPWLATGVAAVLVLFGAGAENITWAYQITMVGSLFFGLIQLLLADHDGRIGRRDAVALLAGLTGLLCSGLAPVMVAVVGIATMRRGWRAAALQTVPLAAVYLLWSRAFPVDQPFGSPPLDVYFRWIRYGEGATFTGLGQLTPIVVLLVVVCVVGLAVAWLPLDLRSWRDRAALPLALLFGVPLLFGSVASVRWIVGEQFAGSQRYVYTGALFTLPALAVAIYALGRRWRPLAPILFLLLLIGVPGNLVAMEQDEIFNAGYFATQKEVVLGAPRWDLAAEAPAEIRPVNDQFVGPGLTIGWLRDAEDAGKLPPYPLTPKLASQFTIRLGIVQRDGGVNQANCHDSVEPEMVDLRAGESIGIGTRANVSAVEPNGAVGTPVRFDPAGGGTLTTWLPDLRVRVSRAGSPTFSLCTVPT